MFCRSREESREGGRREGGRNGEDARSRPRVGPYLEAGEAEEGPGEGVMVAEDVGLREGVFCLRQVTKLGGPNIDHDTIFRSVHLLYIDCMSHVLPIEA